MVLSRMTLDDKISMVTGSGSVAAIPRLCVPAMELQDGPSGVGDGLTGGDAASRRRLPGRHVGPVAGV
jgi:hypothetical protein